jgi:chaperonin GroEL (HSP60 family)
MAKLNVIEPYRVGKHAINSATDAAVMILRIDDVIASSGSSKDLGVGEGGMPPGMDDD